VMILIIYGALINSPLAFMSSLTLYSSLSFCGSIYSFSLFE
jgi:hypothetical protein